MAQHLLPVKVKCFLTSRVTGRLEGSKSELEFIAFTWRSKSLQMMIKKNFFNIHILSFDLNSISWVFRERERELADTEEHAQKETEMETCTQKLRKRREYFHIIFPEYFQYTISHTMKC